MKFYSRQKYKNLFLPTLLFILYFGLLIIAGLKLNNFFSPWSTAIILLILNVTWIDKAFNTPKDALVNAINAGLLGIILFFQRETAGYYNFAIILIYILLIVFPAVIYLINYEKNKKISILEKIAAYLGRTFYIFPIVAILSIVKISSNRVYNISVDNIRLFIGMLLFLVVAKILSSYNFRIWLDSKLTGKRESLYFGKVTTNQTPNIVLVEFNTKSNVKINDLIVFGNIDIDEKIKKDYEDKFGLVLDFIGNQNGNNLIMARIYLLNEPQRDLNENKGGIIKKDYECRVIRKPDEIIKKINSKKVKYYWERRKDIVALVAPFSNINQLRGEIIRHQQLENAELISVINYEINNPIYYQIIDAETRRESHKDRKDFGYTQLMAYQLGEWRKPRNRKGEDKKSMFHQFFEFQWVPNINSLVFKWNNEFDGKDINDREVDKSDYCLIGTIPKTNLPIYLNIIELVSHHTALLGITGAGKTTMMFRLLEEIANNNILILCLDITGEYKEKINNHEDFFDTSSRNAWVNKINEIIDAKRRKGLSYSESEKLTSEDSDKIINECISNINKIIANRINQLRKLKKVVIVEITEISNTRISIDYTQYLIQGLLEYAKNVYLKNIGRSNDSKDYFQSCLVLEEAHTLIPENIGVGGRYSESQTVTEKISQIALQGRKYNVGFILISQRTATVKKTVLNQCNTMITFRAYDETSYNFLSNYFGEEYVKEINHLKNDGDSRYVIVAGKAVVADRPIIVEVRESENKNNKSIIIHPNSQNKSKEIKDLANLLDKNEGKS